MTDRKTHGSYTLYQGIMKISGKMVSYIYDIHTKDVVLKTLNTYLKDYEDLKFKQNALSFYL